MTTQPPWKTIANITVCSELKIPTLRTDNINKRKRAAIETINDLPKPDICIWSDGSVIDGTKNGGSGVLV